MTVADSATQQVATRVAGLESVAAQTAPRQVAAIDCGTHSTRLLIAEVSPSRQLQTLVRRTTITGLGNGLGSTGKLSQQAMERTWQCLADYVEQIQGVASPPATSGAASPGGAVSMPVKAVATSAARDAANRDDFFAGAAQHCGLELELLDGETEGQLAFAGATTGLAATTGHAATGLATPEGPYLVCDIGGGSTEFAFGTDKCEGVWSADIGSSRLSEGYIQHDPARPEELTACLSLVELHLDDLLRAIPAIGKARKLGGLELDSQQLDSRQMGGLQLIGLAGTVTTAAAVELGLAVYDSSVVHHFRLTREAVEDVFRTLATENRQQRLENPGLHPNRVDVIVGGLCILVKIMRYLDMADCLVSETDLLDGIAAQLAEKTD